MSKTVAEMIAEANAQIENVSPKDAAAEAAAGKAVLVDVREPVEWEHHIAGAVQVPRGLLEFVADPASPKHRPELDPAGRVIVYCRSGARASSPASRSRRWASRTSPTSRAASAPGRRPACRAPSITTESDTRPPKGPDNGRRQKKVDLSTVPLSWDEVYYTNCPLVSASNVDQELGWTREEFKKIGVKYAFLRSRRENNWYPHYIHNLDNLIRFGGLFPPVARARRHPPHQAARRDACSPRGRLHAGARPRRHLPDEGAEGQEDRAHQEPEHDQERLVAHPGAPGHRADAAGQRHDHGRRRDRRVPLPGRLVRQPEMLDPMENPSELWLKRDHKHDLAFRPLETALENGRRRRDLHPEQAVPAPAGGDRQVQVDRGPVPVSRTGRCRSPTSPPSSPAPTRWPSSTPSSSSRS